MSFKSLFLPIGLCLGMSIGLMAPGLGIYMKEQGIVPYLIMFIFLINGIQTKVDNFKFNREFLIALIGLSLINLILSPFIAKAISSFFNLQNWIELGLVVIAAVPTTLSSGIVITELARGHVVWALFMTIMINFLSIFTLPIFLKYLLGEGMGFQISVSELLFKLMFLVCFPFVLGVFINRFQQRTRLIPGLGYIPSFCVILVMWMSVSVSYRELLGVTLIPLCIAISVVISLHSILLLICWLWGLGLRLSFDKRITLLFVGSEKTLPLALAVLTFVDVSIGLALVVCILFHFLQLMIDSILASRIARYSGRDA